MWACCSSSALLARLWRCGARGWACVCSVAGGVQWSCFCGGTASWWHSPAWLCVAAHVPQGPASFAEKNLRCVTPCPTVCTRNTSSMQEQQHLSSVGGCVGCWRCLGRCCLSATLPTFDLTSFPLRERTGNPEIQKTKLNSHCLLTIINLLSSACARRSRCAKHRLSFWRGKEANPDLVSGWKAVRKCFGAASSPLAGV